MMKSGDSADLYIDAVDFQPSTSWPASPTAVQSYRQRYLNILRILALAKRTKIRGYLREKQNAKNITLISSHVPERRCLICT
jgi:hypothetical protein